MILFLVTWLEMLMDLLQSQPYQAISDVVRIWQARLSLTYFEDRVSEKWK